MKTVMIGATAMVVTLVVGFSGMCAAKHCTAKPNLAQPKKQAMNTVRLYPKSLSSYLTEANGDD